LAQAILAEVLLSAARAVLSLSNSLAPTFEDGEGMAHDRPCEAMHVRSA